MTAPAERSDDGALDSVLPANGTAGALAKRMAKPTESWYFARLALLAIPWKQRQSKRAKGVLFRQYYLLQAKNIQTAFKKAKHILNVSEHTDGSGSLNGKRVSLKAIGILDLEPLYQPLQSGAELFDESESGVTAESTGKLVISKNKELRMIRREQKTGKQKLIDVYRGSDFDRL